MVAQQRHGIDRYPAEDDASPSKQRDLREPPVALPTGGEPDLLGRALGDDFLIWSTSAIDRDPGVELVRYPRRG